MLTRESGGACANAMSAWLAVSDVDLGDIRALAGVGLCSSLDSVGTDPEYSNSSSSARPNNLLVRERSQSASEAKGILVSTCGACSVAGVLGTSSVSINLSFKGPSSVPLMFLDGTGSASDDFFFFTTDWYS